jgi:hypothetical protein
MASGKRRAAKARASAPKVKGRRATQPAAATKPAAKKDQAKKGVAKKGVAKKAAKAPVAKKGDRKKAAATRPTARKVAPRVAPKPMPSKARASVARRPRRATVLEERGPRAVPGLSEEEQIRAAKYLPRELPRKVFEEERFLFPETYGVNRIRLLVRDPEWIFAYWDVSPASVKDLGKSLGERALALSRLTLRVLDPVGGGSSDILLPPGARWWYVRTDNTRRTYRAELGVTLPSGEFRRLAESNTVVTPRVGPSAEGARRRMSYRDARELSPAAARAAALAEREKGVARRPLEAGALDGASAPAESGAAAGGASDVFRPGGASDTYRR